MVVHFLVGALSTLEVAGMVEAEDDLVLVLVGTARPKDIRAEVARGSGGGSRDPHGPIFELLRNPASPGVTPPP